MIAEVVGTPDEDRNLIAGWAERGRRGLDACWDSDLKLYLDYDLRAGKPLRVRTVAGFAPLSAGQQSPERLEALLEILDSPVFTGHPRLAWPLPPSTSPEELRFDPRSYLRGPTWPVINWLLWWSLLRAGEPERAERLRRIISIEQLASGGGRGVLRSLYGCVFGFDPPVLDRRCPRLAGGLAVRALIEDRRPQRLLRKEAMVLGERKIRSTRPLHLR